MTDGPALILPEVRQIEPGAPLLLCRCGRSPTLPDCPVGCTQGLALLPSRRMHLILCRCGRSKQLPYCDGRHQAVAAKGWSLRRFLRG